MSVWDCVSIFAFILLFSFLCILCCLSLWGILLMFSLFFSFLLCHCTNGWLLHSAHNCTKLRFHAIFSANITSPSAAKKIIWKINMTCACARLYALENTIRKMKNMHIYTATSVGFVYIYQMRIIHYTILHTHFSKVIYIYQDRYTRKWMCLLVVCKPIKLSHWHTGFCSCWCHPPPPPPRSENKKSIRKLHRLLLSQLESAEN